MLTYNELVKKLKEIKEMGWIKTHRTGPTGIGKTLEDLLGITENNVPGPNTHMVELKSARKSAKSMLTLFTKSPLPKKANSLLLQRFGYDARGNKKLDLHTTVNALGYNKLRGQTGFKVEIGYNRVELVSKNKSKKGLLTFVKNRKGKAEDEKEMLGYWDKATLKKSFERKLPRLMYVKADSRGGGKDENFWFNEVWLLSGFNFKNFLKLLRSGDILVDIRIGQYPDGRPHDHGTGFRVHPDKLELCFQHRNRIM